MVFKFDFTSFFTKIQFHIFQNFDHYNLLKNVEQIWLLSGNNISFITMATIIRSFKEFLAVERSLSYSNVLWLHHPISSSLVLINVILATTYVIFGDIITCTGGSHPFFSQKMIDNFCYINPTLEISFGWVLTYDILILKFLIIIQCLFKIFIFYRKSTILHRHPIFYQWVLFIFSFQAVVFCIPKWILDFFDNGHITKVIKGN